MDPWYGLGSHDMLEVAHMAVHIGHMTGVEEMRALFAGVTTTAAAALHLEGYGLEPGCHADLVVLQARDLRSRRSAFARPGSTCCAGARSSPGRRRKKCRLPSATPGERSTSSRAEPNGRSGGKRPRGTTLRIDTEASTMEYRYLGRTGVQVSPVGLGSDDFGDGTPPDLAARIILRSLDAGINLIDTGNLYAGGTSEAIIGQDPRGQQAPP